jgi:hypothetical protein
MKTQRHFSRALTALAVAAIGTVAWAAPGPKECGLIGTWAGAAGGSMQWMAIHTAGSTDDKSGEMLLDLFHVENYLLNPAAVTAVTGSPATRMSGGHGVWQQHQLGRGHYNYNYTWYTYGINESGYPVYTVRVRGVATNTDCDNVQISYTYEVFPAAFPPQAVVGTPLYSTSSEDAGEMRVPLMTP